MEPDWEESVRHVTLSTLITSLEPNQFNTDDV